MSSAEWAVIVWTVAASAAWLLSGTMIATRWLDLRAAHRHRGNGDRSRRIVLARHDVSRSAVRHVGFTGAAIVGGLFTIVQHTHWLDHPPRWLREHWVWLLVLMIFTGAVNEVLDRMTTHRLRRMDDDALAHGEATDAARSRMRRGSGT